MFEHGKQTRWEIVYSGTFDLDKLRRQWPTSRFRYTANNFNTVMARNAALTIVEVRSCRFWKGANLYQAENIVEIGELSPNSIHLPGIYVDRVVPASAPKKIEFTTLAPSDNSPHVTPTDRTATVPRVTEDVRHRIGRRAAKEIEDGFYVNLGIGIPTLVPEYLEPGMRVWLQSENGILGMVVTSRINSCSECVF